MIKKQLKNKLLKQTKYENLSIKNWDKKCKSRGTHIKKDYQVDKLENLLPKKINKIQEQLEKTRIKPLLTIEQKLWYKQKIQEIDTDLTEVEKKVLIKNITKTEKKELIEEQDKLLRQKKELFEEYEREDKINYLKEKVERLKDKFICIVKEKEIRKLKLFPRSPIGTTYYLDFNGNTGTLSGTWTFTGGFGTVSGSGGAATSELITGNYIRVSNGTEWYKITGITDDNTITISPAFQQATVTDTAGVTQYNNYDGTAITTSFVHMNQYTTDTVRNAGDILKVRANQTHHYDGIDIDFDEDGNANNLLTIKGCSSIDDPWGDASDVKPIISFGDTSYQLYVYFDNYWKFERLELIESDDINGVIDCHVSIKTFLLDCVIRDNTSGGTGMCVYYDLVEVDGCEFYNNKYNSIENHDGYLIIKNSVFNSGDIGTQRGIYSSWARLLQIENSTFGVTTAHSSSDIQSALRTFTRNCIFASSTEFSTNVNSFIGSEDHDQVKGSHKRVAYNGTVTRDTGTIRSGGATSSAKLEPNDHSGLYYSLTISDDFAGDFKFLTPASQETVTIYLDTFGYSPLPTATELYIEASYLDGTSGGHRAILKSTNTVSANDTWTAFSITFTPSQEGWTYVTLYLKKYQASSGVFVDIKPIIS